MRRLLLALVLAAGLCSCGSDPDTPLAADAAVDTSIADSTTDSAVDTSADTLAPDAKGLSSCLDRPDELPVAPGPTLPCELIPPGVTL